VIIEPTNTVKLSKDPTPGKDSIKVAIEAVMIRTGPN